MSTDRAVSFTVKFHNGALEKLESSGEDGVAKYMKLITCHSCGNMSCSTR